MQARKLGEKKTVEALARQFQDQIERILTHKVSIFPAPASFATPATSPPHQAPIPQGQVAKTYLPSRQEQEVEEFKKLHREKSFDEARTAVQSQVGGCSTALAPRDD